MITPSTSPEKKIVILGLAESGKSTIIKNVIEGEKTELGERYSATINYQRKVLRLCGVEITLFDLGGQTRFLDKFTGDLSQFVFSNVDSFIFVIEPLQSAFFSRAKYYLELSIEKLKLFSPEAKIFIFFHKMDLIPPQNREIISQSLGEYLTSEIVQQIQYFNTSVFSETAFKAVGSIISEVLYIKPKLCHIIEKFSKNGIEAFNQIHLLTHAGAFLFQVSNERVSEKIPLKIVKEYFDRISGSNQIMDKENAIISLESNEHLYLVHFLERGLTILVIVSKTHLFENVELSSRIYNSILILGENINLLSDFNLMEGN
jgi:GTPase SAR1 family protein